MTDPAETQTGDLFDPKKQTYINKTLNKIIEIRGQRDALQEKINSLLKDLEAEGIKPKAAKRVLALKKLDEEQLAEEDASEAACREALGIGVQSGLKLVRGGKDD